MISKHYNKDSEVKIGNIFYNKEALDLAVRLKVLEDGYRFLSKKSNADRKNEGIVTRFKTNEEGVFEMLCIAIGASIHMFINHLRPLLIIDAAHLKGVYKGTNLLVVGMDRNNQIVHIAFGICKGETSPCLGSKKQKDYSRAYTPEEFTSKMNILHDVQLDAYNKLIEAGPPRWKATNHIVNRDLSCNGAKVVFKRREVAANIKYEITNLATDKVEKRKLKSVAWVINEFNQYQYQVSDGRYNREVNFITGSCKCRKWQVSGIPYGHVIAVTWFLGLTDCVQFVAD
ncbi:hypothetical protein Tco_0240573 [Tanacetum coccineum]